MRRRIATGLALLGIDCMGAPVRAPLPRPVAAEGALVFDGATVVDVEHGKLIASQRVVVVGNRIRTVGAVDRVRLPAGARRIDARGKYLIPGLWDSHTHSRYGAERTSYPLMLANGVTGFRDAGSAIPLDTLTRWRREILAGTRVGPPRQLLSGPSINQRRDGDHGVCRYQIWICIPGRQSRSRKEPVRSIPAWAKQHPVGVDPAQVVRARRILDSLRVAGADMLKLREVSREMYFRLAAEGRRLGIPFGGHAEYVTAIEASDSGARIVDHLYFYEYWPEDLCGVRSPSLAQCQAAATHLRRNGTWVEADLFPCKGENRRFEFQLRMHEFWADSLRAGNWLRGPAPLTEDDSTVFQPFMRLMQASNMPLLAGTDVDGDGSCPWQEAPPGFMLHANLAEYVVLGLTPLRALQTATLNPAEMWHATDSLGTVAPGKLADLVLLDADPLADITNTTAIRAVVANGRYFDRAALDRLLDDVRRTVSRTPIP